MIAILIHGFNVWDGGVATVGKLRPFFADLAVPYVMVNYGHFGIIETRLKNRKIARRVARAVTNARSGNYQVIVVGHSNGCAIAHLAAEEYGAQIDRAVYINPALEEHIGPPVGIRSLHVWHSPSDRPVKWAEWLPGCNARPWGEMGATGYIGRDDRVENFNKEQDFTVSSSGHSDMFSIEQIGYFGPIVAARAVAGMNPQRGVQGGRQGRTDTVAGAC